MLPGFNSGGSLSNQEVRGVTGVKGNGKWNVDLSQHGIGEADVSLMSVLKAVQNLQVSVDSKFMIVEANLLEFRKELSEMKQDMVSQKDFKHLESRVQDLETQGIASEDLKILRQQMSKLDPANKSLRIRELKGDDLAKRIISIEEILSHIGMKYNSLDHIYKGPPGQRSLTDM